MGQMLQFEAVCRKPPSVGSFPAHGPVRQGRRITQPPSPRAAPRRRTSQRRTGTSPCAARLARWDSSPRGGSACREQRRGGGGLADSSPELPETPTGPLLSPDALRREIRGEWPDWPRARRLSLQVPTARPHPLLPPALSSLSLTRFRFDSRPVPASVAQPGSRLLPSATSTAQGKPEESYLLLFFFFCGGY
jgi:hypothetical protein